MSTPIGRQTDDAPMHRDSVMLGTVCYCLRCVAVRRRRPLATLGERLAARGRVIPQAASNSNNDPPPEAA